MRFYLVSFMTLTDSLSRGSLGRFSLLLIPTACEAVAVPQATANVNELPFGRYQPGRKASSPPRADLARSSYFAQECFAKTRLGSWIKRIRSPSTGSAGASTFPRIWSRSINAR